jgi:hypothetical protein
VVTGRSRPLPEQECQPFIRSQWFQEVAGPDAVGTLAGGVLGRNCALRREVVDALRPFDAPAATGTDYVLSMQLLRAREPIHLAADSRVATDFPSDPASYVRMLRRWMKNVLVHGPRYGAWPEVASVLATVAVAGGVVATPLGARWVGPVAVLPSASVVAIGTLNRVRRTAIGARLAGERYTAADAAQAPLLIGLDLAAAIAAAVDAIVPARRPRW